MNTLTHRHIHTDMHRLGVKIEHLLHDKGFWTGIIALAVIAGMFALIAVFATTAEIPELPQRGVLFFPY